MSNIKFSDKDEVKRYAFNKIAMSLSEAIAMLKREKIKYRKRLVEKENEILVHLKIIE